MSSVLLSSAQAGALDTEVSAQWGLHPFALVEAAGRACAQAFVSFYHTRVKQDISSHHGEIMRNEGAAVAALGVRNGKTLFENRFFYHHAQIADRNSIPHSSFLIPNSYIVLAGKGNNAADALVMLRALILNEYADPAACRVLCVQEISLADNEKTPLSEAMRAVRMLGVTISAWNTGAADALAAADIVIDGIAGTGLKGPLRDTALEMVNALNEPDQPLVVSIDIPSGNFDGWQPGMSIVNADLTLAIEPQKLCIYTPAARPFAGTIIPVKGIFPSIPTGRYREAELVEWESAALAIPPVPQTAHKYQRGLVEIRAGSPGAGGAAKLAALGAQAAGAGLVRLIVDSSLYPLIASGCTGIMAAPDENTEHGRFAPDAVLLGPGWGRGEDRQRIFERYCVCEEQGLPLILDADAIALARDTVFHGNVVMTPHAGEFAAYTGIPINVILNDPVPILRQYAAEKQVHILFKSHVLYAMSPEGRIGIIDGMNPALAAGGSGDVLAGFCAAIAARLKPFDGFTCMCAAASLLIQAAKTEALANTFFDPADLAKAAAAIAGKAWLH